MPNTEEKFYVINQSENGWYYLQCQYHLERRTHLWMDGSLGAKLVEVEETYFEKQRRDFFKRNAYKFVDTESDKVYYVQSPLDKETIAKVLRAKRSGIGYYRVDMNFDDAPSLFTKENDNEE